MLGQFALGLVRRTAAKIKLVTELWEDASRTESCNKQADTMKQIGQNWNRHVVMNCRAQRERS